MTAHVHDVRRLPRFAWLSALAAIVTIALKTGAWALTGSVGLLSDALESLVNLAGAGLAIAMLTVAARPEDEDHPYGHDKAEYFSSGAEGTLILIAALGIAVAAVRRLLAPRPLEQVGLGRRRPPEPGRRARDPARRQEARLGDARGERTPPADRRVDLGRRARRRQSGRVERAAVARSDRRAPRVGEHRAHRARHSEEG